METTEQPASALTEDSFIEIDSFREEDSELSFQAALQIIRRCDPRAYPKIIETIEGIVSEEVAAQIRCAVDVPNEIKVVEGKESLTNARYTHIRLPPTL